ncbi:hypothetical protein A4H97_04630 [Niastella yeongjuensis]|uniref:Uncharacterized protein n=1 Tax=Niastella yeongjuensis TaxID=354355 RepID=A0A1V9EYD7_9BACT|nr:hypothetical protein [Niastella yeongjuensis]OQP51102.1 hypothetical protein A4H97_04630 [Niastella yeongjuensis]SEN02590.1 hypothetical protein SAMN05660816_00005 [Niastella yeongjuensis]
MKKQRKQTQTTREIPEHVRAWIDKIRGPKFDKKAIAKEEEERRKKYFQEIKERCDLANDWPQYNADSEQ